MKSSISDKIRLQHILDAINSILIFTKDIDYNTYMADYKLRLALVKLIEIIGEASNGLSTEAIRRVPDIEWSILAGIRNVLVHEYFGIDYEPRSEAMVSLTDLCSRLKAQNLIPFLNTFYVFQKLYHNIFLIFQRQYYSFFPIFQRRCCFVYSSGEERDLVDGSPGKGSFCFRKGARQHCSG